VRVRVDKDWFAESKGTLLPLLAERGRAYRAHNSCVLEPATAIKLWQVWKEARTAASDAMITARSLHVLKRASHTQQCFDRGDVPGFWAASKPGGGRKKSKCKMSDTAMRASDKSSVYTSSPAENLKHWVDYAKGLLGEARPLPQGWDPKYLPAQQKIREEMGRPFTCTEILIALRLMKFGKAVGLDGVPIEVQRLLYTRASREILRDALNAMLELGDVPQDWKGVMLVFIHKRCDKSLSSNYRGLGLIAHKGKLLERLIMNRLMPHVKSIPNALDDFNFGYKGGLSPTDAIFVSRLLAQASIARDLPVYEAWIDLVKAYDNVIWEILWGILRRLGVPENMVNLIIALHVGVQARVRLDGVLSDEFFLLLQGLKQGSVFAPLLFLLYEGAILMLCTREYKRLGLGVSIVFSLHGTLVDSSKMDEEQFFNILLSHIGFADDIKLIAKSAPQLQRMTTIFYDYCKIFGLTLNVAKCECMVVQRITAANVELRQRRMDELVIMVGEERMKVVTETQYLGAMENDTGSIGKELAVRCKRLSASFHIWRGVTLNPHITVAARFSIFNSTVVQMGLMNCQTWNNTPAELETLEKTHFRCMKKLLFMQKHDGYPGSERTDMLEIAKFAKKKGFRPVPISTRCRRLQLRYLGHVERMAVTCVQRILLRGFILLGHALPGSTPVAYKHMILAAMEDFGLDPEAWCNAAINRDMWRMLVEGGVKVSTDKWYARQEAEAAERRVAHCEQVCALTTIAPLSEHLLTTTNLGTSGRLQRMPPEALALRSDSSPTQLRAKKG